MDIYYLSIIIPKYYVETSAGVSFISSDLNETNIQNSGGPHLVARAVALQGDCILLLIVSRSYLARKNQKQNASA